MNSQLTSQMLDQLQAKTARTISFDVEHQIKEKYRTFTRFNYRDTLREMRQSKKKKENNNNKVEIGQLLASFFMSTMGELKNQEKPDAKKKKIIVEELAGIKSERRQRFKKAANSIQIVKHYIEKEGFKPNEEEMYLMTSLAGLREFSEQNTLDSILKKIYKFMNEAVDFNQLRFLCLLIMLSADICYQFKDLKRSFYFYNQAKNFASYSGLNTIKAEALISLGQIASEITYYSQAILIYKKALQYAWRTKSIELQILIYDRIGTCYYYQGDLKKANYFHIRFSQGQYENIDSAIKKISVEMLDNYEKYISSLEKKNLTSLFLQYLNLPIVNLETLPITSQEKRKKIYQNYDEDGMSPRRKKRTKKFQFQDFPDLIWQIEKLIKQDQQFKSEIPLPDVQRNFIATQKFGKPRKNISFQQSSQFHKIVQNIPQKPASNKIKSFSLQKRIEMSLKESKKQDWFAQMKDKIRTNQVQKVGQLRDHIINSHQSYYKYPEERRKAQSLKSEKIKQSFNKTLLQWIDPISK